MPLGVLWQQLVLPRVATDGVLWGPHGTLPFALRVPAVVTLPGPVTVPVACQAVSAAESAVLYRPVKLLARTNLT